MENTTIWNHKQIKKARVDFGKNLAETAKLLKITWQYLSMLENGKRQPSQKLIISMAALYGKTINFFLLAESSTQTA